MLKKVISSVLAVATIATMAAGTVSATAMNPNGGCEIEHTIKKADPATVVHDGVISEGEYTEIEFDRDSETTSAMLGFETAAGYGKASEFLENVHFYMSWDEVHGLNVAGKATLLETPTSPATKADLEDAKAASADGVPQDEFLFQFGMMFDVYDGDSICLYRGIGKSTTNGDLLYGYYAGQDGYTGSLTQTEGVDYNVSIDGNTVTYEISFPLESVLDSSSLSGNTPVNGAELFFDTSLTGGSRGFLSGDGRDVYAVGLGDYAYLQQAAAQQNPAHAKGLFSLESIVEDGDDSAADRDYSDNDLGYVAALPLDTETYPLGNSDTYIINQKVYSSKDEVLFDVVGDVIDISKSYILTVTYDDDFSSLYRLYDISTGKCETYPEADIDPDYDAVLWCMADGTIGFTANGGDPKVISGAFSAMFAGYGMIHVCYREDLSGGKLLDTETGKLSEISLPDNTIYVNFVDYDVAVITVYNESTDSGKDCISTGRNGKISFEGNAENLYMYISGGTFIEFNIDGETLGVIDSSGKNIIGAGSIINGFPVEVFGDIVILMSYDFSEYEYDAASPAEELGLFTAYNTKTGKYLPFTFDYYTELSDGTFLVSSGIDSGYTLSKNGTYNTTSLRLLQDSDELLFLYDADTEKSGIYDLSASLILEYDVENFDAVTLLHNSFAVNDGSGNLSVIGIDGRMIMSINVVSSDYIVEVGCVFDDDGSIISVYNWTTDTIEFFRIQNTIVPFSDVSFSRWFYEAVSFCYNNNLMLGFPNNEFCPANTMTRAELAMVLYRIAGEPEVTYTPIFPDVPENKWFSIAVTWAAQNNLVQGFEDGMFRPQDELQRDQLATIFFRYSIMAGRDVSERGDLNDFSDNGNIKSWSADALAWAVGCGLLKGSEEYSSDLGTNVIILNPQGYTTRAEIATVLTRFTISIE